MKSRVPRDNTKPFISSLLQIGPLLDVLGLGPSLPQVVEGVDWAVLHDDISTLASDRISERGLWETHLQEIEGLIDRHSHPMGCRCRHCLWRHLRLCLRKDKCHIHSGNPEGGRRLGGQPVEARMIRLRTISLADYR